MTNVYLQWQGVPFRQYVPETGLPRLPDLDPCPTMVGSDRRCGKTVAIFLHGKCRCVRCGEERC